MRTNVTIDVKVFKGSEPDVPIRSIRAAGMMSSQEAIRTFDPDCARSGRPQEAPSAAPRVGDVRADR
jgi:hypothetical protein